MKSIEEDYKDLGDRISFKEKRMRACENMVDYRKCDELKEEISVLKCQRRELQSELKKLEKAKYQSAWYYRKKSCREEPRSWEIQNPENISSSDQCRSSSLSDRSRSTIPLPLSRSRSTTPLPSSASSPVFRPRSAFSHMGSGEPPFTTPEMSLECTWSGDAPLSPSELETGALSPPLTETDAVPHRRQE